MTSSPLTSQLALFRVDNSPMTTTIPPKIVGFTGTRAGMTRKQQAIVRAELVGAEMAHHGDCIGADAQFHAICLELGVPVTLHPPTNPKQRAWCQGAAYVMPAKPYLTRNKNIVDISTVLVGAPKEHLEPTPARGQGTWSTIRYARKGVGYLHAGGGRLVIAWPDGTS